MIVLDASVLIAHLDSQDVHHQRARSLLLAVVPQPLGVSPITLAEVLVPPARTGDVERALGILQVLRVSTIHLDNDAAARLAALRAATGLKLPDCCVLLAAQQSGGLVATFDERLAAAAEDRGVGLRT